MKVKNLILPLFLIVCMSCSTAKKQDNAIVVQNSYWAKEGKIDEVYQHRLYASYVRDSLGLAVGRVLKRIGREGELSHVIWECKYASESARQEDVDKLTETGAFDPITKKMKTLIDKFERGVYKIN
jgi:hypothetical protein